jgi:hypothetical protein
MSSTRTLKYNLVDAFAERPFMGNPAGVIITPEPLSPDVMQKIARYVHPISVPMLHYWYTIFIPSIR